MDANVIFSLLLAFVAHAILPVLGAIFTKSKSGVIMGAVLAVVIASVLAFFIPTQFFMGASLGGIALGIWVGFSLVKNRYKS